MTRQKSRIRTAVFPVAGLGTRILPATKVMPKEMLPLLDRPLIQHAVDEAREAGIERFVFVNGRGKGMLEEHFDINMPLESALRTRGKKDALERLALSNLESGAVVTVRQAAPLGLGHAVWCAREEVGDEPFAVILPDDAIQGEKGCLAQMVDAYPPAGGNMVAVMDVPREHTSRYGVLSPTSEDGEIIGFDGMVEKPAPEKAPSCLAVVGRYILDPAVFAHLDKKVAGAGGEIQLTDAIAATIGAVPCFGYRFKGVRHDCGDRLGWIVANLSYALRDPALAGDVGAAAERLLSEVDLEAHRESGTAA